MSWEVVGSLSPLILVFTWLLWLNQDQTTDTGGAGAGRNLEERDSLLSL